MLFAISKFLHNSCTKHLSANIYHSLTLLKSAYNWSRQESRVRQFSSKQQGAAVDTFNQKARITEEAAVQPNAFHSDLMYFTLIHLIFK